MYESAARFYDQMHAGLTADIPYVTQLVDAAGGPALELGCGSGRILLPLAEAGHRITGIDNSPQMLALLRRKLNERSSAVRGRVIVVEADITRLHPALVKDSIALALVSHNTLHHFRRDQVRSILHGIASMIPLGSRLFVDVANPFVLAGNGASGEPLYERSFIDDETGLVVEQWSSSQLDSGTQTYNVTWEFRAKGGNTLAVLDVPYHYLFPHQLEMMLRESGFAVEAFRGDYDGQPFAETSERLLIHATLAT
jgi:SAM-dependent methyltransferase